MPADHKTRLGTLVVVGPGLIGGSFALALKAAGHVQRVIGVGRRRATLDEAVRIGVIDEATTDLASVAGKADLVLLATPVGQMAPLMQTLAATLAPHAVVTDGGSTKGDVVAAARTNLGNVLARFVPAHPIAGAENSGPAAARSDLYVGKKVVVAATADSAPDAIACVEAAWRACGAELHRMSPERHDAIFAAVSHLPHLLSYALVHDLACRDDADEFFRYAASGFRDFTRIAASHPEMWRDICLANREALLREIERYQQELARLKHCLEEADGECLNAIFDVARTARRQWAEGQS